MDHAIWKNKYTQVHDLDSRKNHFQSIAMRKPKNSVAYSYVYEGQILYLSISGQLLVDFVEILGKVFVAQ